MTDNITQAAANKAAEEGELPVNEHQYRKKPVVIEAFQFQRRNNGPIGQPDWFHDAVTRNDVILQNTGKWGDITQPAYCEIKTLEGAMRGEEGDWIIRGVKGEIYPCKPDIFAATYEQASASRQVANKAEVGGKIMPEKLTAEMWRAWEGISNHLSTKEMDEIYAAMYEVTPPATTGASTALMGAVKNLFWEFEKGAAPFTVKAALDQIENDEVQVSIDPKYAREIFAAAGLFGEQAPASTVLMDERIAFEAWARTACNMPDYANINWDASWTKQAWEGWKARSEVAAQAGQVTVPEFDLYMRSRVANLLHLLQFATITTPSHGDADQAKLVMADLRRNLAKSAPSPAKESK